MPICDGDACSVSIPWRITKSSLQLSSENRAFSVERTSQMLNRILWLTYQGVYDDLYDKVMAGGVATREPALKSLCSSCWLKQAAKWGDVGTYAPARAKTDATGCFFQVNDAAFIVNHRPDVERILSCVVHELMHFWSHQSTGLQQFNRGVGGVDWDEASADILGFRTYREQFRGTLGNYVTPYNRYPVALETQIAAVPNFRWNQWKNTGSAEHGALPVKLQRMIANDPAIIQQTVLAAVPGTLFSGLATWFFVGPHAVAGSIGKNAVDYLSVNGISRLITLSTVFPGYGGGADVAHPI